MSFAIFDTDWCLAFISYWNRKAENRNSLADIGTVSFEVLCDVSPRHVTMHFDDTGSVKLREDDGAEDEEIPCFYATEREWRAFISGSVTALEAIMLRKIEFTGPLAFAVEYGERFDIVAAAARHMETELTS